MGGTIVSQTALEGQTLNANQSAPVIVRVADLDTMTVWAQVAEADVVKLTPGMPAYFSTLAFQIGAGRGRCSRSSRRRRPSMTWSSTTPSSTSRTTITVLMTSMTAQVFFILGEAKGVPLVR
jgi:macrolide-specific efflux system membrane fusion protein